MEGAANRNKKKGWFLPPCDSHGGTGGSGSGIDSSSTSSFSSSRPSLDTSSDEAKAEYCSSPVPLGWPIFKAQLSKRSSLSDVSGDKLKSNFDTSMHKKLDLKTSEMDIMKEKFAKLLLGEDMSGSGKGVCTALAISNAITNLYATVFGQLWRLEPLPSEKKSMWRREMECLLCISDHIVEFMPSWQTFPDGSKLEVMSCKPRPDLSVNLPALRKLDNMLLEILDGFKSTEFWYVDRGVVANDAEKSAAFRKSFQRQEEKWWLPVPRVASGGLEESTRKELIHRRESANQILKASMAINSVALSEMGVPDSFLEALPKNGRGCLGDVIYRYITSEQFSADCLLDCLDLSSEHYALEIANRVEASMHLWYKRLHSKPAANPNRSTAKSSWDIVKDLMADGDKRESLVRRAESLLLCLKQRFPGLTQTTLETCKIQSNKDVGKAILESYSRVLESLAFNVVSRIDDLLYVDDLTRQSDHKLPSSPMVSAIAQKKAPLSFRTPKKSIFGTPKFSPAAFVSPAKGERTPIVSGNNNNKTPRRGLGVKKALTNYLGASTETNAKNSDK